MLTHLSGDIAQPLHVGEGYVGKNGGFVVPTQKQLDDKEAFRRPAATTCNWTTPS
jgi:hypothetical protein